MGRVRDHAGEGHRWLCRWTGSKMVEHEAAPASLLMAPLLDV